MLNPITLALLAVKKNSRICIKSAASLKRKKKMGFHQRGGFVQTLNQCMWRILMDLDLLSTQKTFLLWITVYQWIIFWGSQIQTAWWTEKKRIKLWMNIMHISKQRQLLNTSILKLLKEKDYKKKNWAIVTVTHLRRKILTHTYQIIRQRKSYTIQNKLIWISFTTYFPQTLIKAKKKLFIHTTASRPLTLNRVSLLLLIYLENILELIFRQSHKITELKY